VLVKAGQPVKTGQVLAKFRLTRPDVSRLQAMLSKVGIQRLQLKLEGALKDLKDLDVKLAEAKRMVRQKLAPQATLEQAQAERDLGAGQIHLLNLELVEAKKTLHNRALEVAEWTGHQAPLGRLPEICAITAPISGHIIWVNGNLRPNALVPPPSAGGQASFLVGVMNPMVIKAKVHEMEAMRLKVGDKAQVQVDSLPGRSLPAKVSRLDWSPDTLDPVEASYYQVELALPNDELLLKNGLKCRVTISQ
jgi:multidrug resistance efflux pump